MTREEFPALQVSVSVLCNFEVSPWKVFLLRKSYTSGWSWLCRLGSGDSWDQNWVSEWKREQEDSHFFARGWFPSSQMRDVNWLQVPLAQGWDKIQTIDSLLRKGGWRGQVLQFCVWKYRCSVNWCILFSKAIRYFTWIVKVTPEVRSQIRLVRYQSELVSVTYQDYLQHCRQASYIHGYSRSSIFLWRRNNCFQGHTSQVKVAGRALTRDQNCTGVSCDQRGVCEHPLSFHLNRQVPFGSVQYSTRLPPEYQPPIYCSAPGEFQILSNFTKFCSKHYFAIYHENLSRSCPLPPTLPCSALPAKPPPIVASSGLDDSNCKPRWQRRSNTEHAADDQAPTCK